MGLLAHRLSGDEMKKISLLLTIILGLTSCAGGSQKGGGAGPSSTSSQTNKTSSVASMSQKSSSLGTSSTSSPTNTSSSIATGPGEPHINEAGGLPAGYESIFSDEFDKDGAPDPTKWGYDVDMNKGGWPSGEKQYYSNARSKNARVENGKLVIEAHRERLNATEFPDWGGQEYTSARLFTRDKFTFTYGFVEVRAKTTCQIGSWPAIWTLASPLGRGMKWPDDGEIDILEYVGWNSGMVYQTVHTRDYYWKTNNQKDTITPIADACTEFHRYQLTWTKDWIKLGIDDRNYLSFKNDGSGNYGSWPFFQPHYILLNLAVGGDFGGKQGVDDSSFPWTYEVDYVHVFQKKDE